LAFGLTDAGFSLKRQEDIQGEIEDDIRAIFGSSINLAPETDFGQLIGIISEREALIWELMEEVYNSQYPDTSTGVSLDNAASLTGTTRLAATSSTISEQLLFGTAATFVPAGTLFSNSGDPTAIFSTDAAVTLIAGTDEVQTISFDATPDSGSFTIEFRGATSAAIGFADSAATITATLEAMSTIGTGNVVVTGSITSATGLTLTFGGGGTGLGLQDLPQVQIASNALLIGATPVVVTPATSVEGVPQGAVTMTATTTGPIAAPANSLTVIDTPVAGLTSTFNTEDANLGRDIETDTELKIRRVEDLEVAGAATLEAIRANLQATTGVTTAIVFQNNSDITDTEGRPAHSVEAVVIGGTDADIADTLFNSVAAGITYHGSVTEVVTDSQGFSQTIKFSRPTEVEITLEVDLTVDGSFPTDGIAQVEAAILAYGAALEISQDVIVNPQLICSYASVPGILNSVIRIGPEPLPAAGSTTFTASSDAGDLLLTTAGAHGLAVDNRVRLSTTGTLPTGLDSTTTYSVIDVPSTTSLKLSADRAGDSIPFTDAGTGTHTASYGGFDANIEIYTAEIADFDSGRITIVTV
jgi:uncharacterized phage protein gp47/JayE